jgi:hypothetical protein
MGDDAAVAAFVAAWAGDDSDGEAIARRGVSLAFLNDFFTAFVAPHANAAKRTGQEVLHDMVTHAQARGVTRLASLFPGAEGVPCAYVCFVWSMPFADVLGALNAHYGALGADPAKTFVWVFVFAHGYRLHPDGVVRGTSRAASPAEMMARVQAAVSLSGTTLVVLDKRAVALRRAWCLLEMSFTQPHNLLFLTPRFSEAELADAFDKVPDNWDDIACWFADDKRMIRAAVEARAGSLAAFRDDVRLRLLLSPTSHAALVPLLQRALGALMEQHEQAAAARAAQAVAAAAVAAVQPAPSAAAAPGDAADEQPAQVLLSYRVPESGAVANGGDGWTFQLADALRARGFTVFVGETSMDAGTSWAQTIQRAVRDCAVFVPVCSATYGSPLKSRWTLRELELADARNKHIVPVWHSGAYPPEDVEIYLGGKQRVPSGVNGDVRGMRLEDVVDELMADFAKLKPTPCLPRGAAAAASAGATASLVTGSGLKRARTDGSGVDES